MRPITVAQILSVTRRHGVHPRYEKEWRGLLNDGRLDHELGRRIATCDNYRAALHDLLEINPLTKGSFQCSLT